MSRDNDRNNITDDNVQNGEGHTYVGGSNTSDMELDERDMQLADDVAKEKKIKLVIALSAVLLAIIAVVVRERKSCKHIYGRTRKLRC